MCTCLGEVAMHALHDQAQHRDGVVIPTNSAPGHQRVSSLCFEPSLDAFGLRSNVISPLLFLHHQPRLPENRKRRSRRNARSQEYRAHKKQPPSQDPTVSPSPYGGDREVGVSYERRTPAALEPLANRDANLCIEQEKLVMA